MGSLWITLDDNEAHYLKVVVDEISWAKLLHCGPRMAETGWPPNESRGSARFTITFSFGGKAIGEQ